MFKEGDIVERVDDSDTLTWGAFKPKGDVFVVKEVVDDGRSLILAGSDGKFMACYFTKREVQDMEININGIYTLNGVMVEIIKTGVELYEYKSVAIAILHTTPNQVITLKSDGYCPELSEYISEHEFRVDDKILVRDHHNDPWIKRYFARKDGNRIGTFMNGATSWSIDNDSDIIVYWREWKKA